ncbi:MAG TPA: hypothetical protein VGB07_23705, partial [Blastocatellia bacterium]
ADRGSDGVGLPATTFEPQASHRVAPAVNLVPQFVQNVMDSRSTSSNFARKSLLVLRVVFAGADEKIALKARVV